MSVDRLLEKIMEKQNPTVAGLDPRLSYIPQGIREEARARYGDTFRGAAEAILAFNRGLIDSLWDVVPAVKPQIAYYELYGYEGVRAFYETAAYARAKGLYVVADVKRNDIGSTAQAYASAYLGETELFEGKAEAFPCDGATVNAYLGTDGIAPFVAECEKGKMIFVLCKTSNPSSGEFQDRKLAEGESLFEAVGEKIEAWGRSTRGAFGYSGVGAVVGATYPAELAALRAKLPHTCFLVPGFGAQGGGAGDVAGAFDKRGLGALINNSRGLMCAWQKSGTAEFGAAAREAALEMKRALLDVLGGRIG